MGKLLEETGLFIFTREMNPGVKQLWINISCQHDMEEVVGFQLFIHSQIFARRTLETFIRTDYMKYITNKNRIRFRKKSKIVFLQFV